MPRPLREDYEGAWHHVMNRGAGHSPVMATDTDKHLFLDCLVEATRRYRVEVHCYCLMSTHYHLLVRSAAAQLPDAMRYFSGKFTRIKNRRADRDGPLFRGRFTSVAIESDAHLVQASRYIHLNPVEAALASSASEWPWSSAAAFVGQAERPTWLHTEFLLAMFGPGAGESLEDGHPAPARISPR